MAPESLTDSLEETLELFDGSGTPQTTTEVAERLDLGRRSTYDRLERLVECGRLETKKVGASARVWWLPPSGTNTEESTQLRHERNLLDRVLETSPTAIGVFDAEGNLIRVNEQCADFLGVDQSDPGEYTLGDRPLRDESGDVIPYSERPAVQALEIGEPVTGRRLRADDADGQTRWFSVNARPLDDNTDEVVVTMADVTQLQKQARRLERQRADLEAELDRVLERIDDAVHGLDEEWCFTYLNDRAEQLLGKTEAELLGTYVWDAFPDALDHSFRDNYERAMATQEPVVFEEYSDAAGAWLEVAAYPSDDGLSVYFRDVTERKEREQELARFEKAVEASGHAIYMTDADGEITYVNPAFEETTGYTAEEVVGETPSILQSGEHDDDYYRALWETVYAGEVWEEEITDRRKDGELYHAEQSVSPVTDEHGEIDRFVAVQNDITERKERERALEESERQYRTLVEHFPNGAVTLVDEELRYVTFGGSLAGDTEVSRADLEGEPLREVLPQRVADVVVPRYEAALEGEPSRFESTIDGRIYQFRFVPVRDDDGEVFAALGMSQDVTGRKRHEERLRTLHDSTRELFRADSAFTIDRLLVETAGDVLDLLGVVVFRYDPSADLLVPQAASAESSFMRERFPVVSPDDSSITGHTFRRGEPTYVEDILESPYLMLSQATTGMRAGLFVPLGEEGILVAGSPDVDGFDASTRQLVELLATNAEAAYERVTRERNLTRHREQLVALNALNEVVRDITSAVLEQSTREEIEKTVCERLAEPDSYRFAWIGEADMAAQTVELRTEAGVDGYLDGIRISVDPDDEYSDGPTGRAFKTGEMQVVHDVSADPRYELWREHAESYGVRSMAAIPIVHESTVYGVLNVYTDRQRAFEGQEQVVISQLGEIVGHAIAAAERKRALLSDEVVELEFRADAFRGVEIAPEGRITFDEAIPIGDDEYLVYGTATPDAVESLSALVEAVPYWTDVTFRDGTDTQRFELRLSEPPILSAIASLGGSVEESIIEEGDYRMTLHLSPSTDAERIIESIREGYPSVEMIARRQIHRPVDTSESVSRILEETLTDRQRATIRAAYHAGFFEWPRDVSGETVAESMDVAPATFSQHLRKAEKKVFDALLSAPGRTVE